MDISFEILPDELMLEIFSYCKVENLVLDISKVCTRWQRLCKDRLLWEDLDFHVTPWTVKKAQEILQSCSYLHSLTLYSDIDLVAAHLKSHMPLHTINLWSAVTPKPPIVHKIAEMFPRLKHFGIMFRDCDVFEYLNIFNIFECVEHVSISYSGRQSGVISRILKYCPTVTGLNVSGTGCFWLNDEDLVSIINEKRDSLQHLELNGLLFTTKSLSLLTQCWRLKCLRISSSDISEDKLESIRELNSLRSLHLHQAKNISPKFYQSFFNSANLVNLTELTIFQCRFSDLATLLLTHNCPRLKVLKLKIISQDCNGSEEDIYDLNFLRLRMSKRGSEAEKCQSKDVNDLFPYLDYFTEEMFTDTGLAAILINLKFLQELEIVSKNVTDRYFHLILVNLRRILHCRIRGSSCQFSWPDIMHPELQIGEK